MQVPHTGSLIPQSHYRIVQLVHTARALFFAKEILQLLCCDTDVMLQPSHSFASVGDIVHEDRSIGAVSPQRN